MRLREVRSHTYWHGSDKKNLKTLEPQDSILVKKKVVFVAVLPEVAVAMTGHWTDSDFTFGRSVRKGEDKDEVPYVMTEKREGAFDDFFSKPVSLYEVDGKGFHSNSAIADFEVISEKPVKIENEHRIDNPLDYLENSKMVTLKRKKA